MGKRKKEKPGAPYKGFRFGVTSTRKLNLQFLNSCKVLTSLQHDMVQESLDRCTITKKVEKLEDEKTVMVDEVKVLAEPIRIAMLLEQLEKPFNEAKVDHLGNPWEKAKELTKEEIEELNKKALKEKNKEVVVEDEEVIKKLKDKNKEK